MTFNTHEQFIASNKSEKVILGHIHASKRLYNFSIDSGLYSRETSQFVNKVFSGNTELTRVSSTGDVTDNTKFFFDITASKLYLFEFDQVNDEIIVEYRFFFSNVPIILPWDLASGSEVEYEPRIISTPNFKSKMSQGKKGINLVGTGDLKINNNDGFYDGIYDTIFFENKTANIYSHNRDLAATEAKILFRGIITGKTFSTQDITFKLNDNLYNLDNLVSTTQYGSEVIPEDSTVYKRIIYGRVNNVQVQSLDKYGDSGISLTGTLSGVKDSDFIKGSGTSFLSELSEGDIIKLPQLEVTVRQVKSDTIVKVSKLITTFNNQAARVSPSVQYNNKNREFQVAGHAIKKVSTTIASISSRNRLNLTSVEGFSAGDVIDLDGEEKTIRRVSGNTIVLTTNYNLPHTAGDPVAKKEMFNVRYNKDSNVIASSDITISNTSAGAKFTISSDAEINVASNTRVSQIVSWISGAAGVWVGTPHIVNLGIVAGSMFETYFIVYDVDGTSTAYWFKDNSPDDATPYAEPAHGADNSHAISLSQDTPSISELISVVVDSLSKYQDNYQITTSGTDVTLTSINPENITNPSAGTSGFSVTDISTGAVSDSNINLKDLLSPRDFIIANDGTPYDILSVNEKSLVLRSNFAGGIDENVFLNYKNLDFINDDAVVYLDCFGKTLDGQPSGDLIETGPEIVLDLIKNVGLSDFVDTASFANSSIRSDVTMSLIIPENISSEPSSAKDVINKINKSIIGSLYVNNDLDLGYDILDSDIEVDNLRTISESDLLNWSVKADGFDLTRKTIGNFRFIDFNPISDSTGFSQVSYTSEFVEKYVGNNNTRELDLYVYNEDDAQELVERDIFINSLSNSTIKIKGKINLSKFRLGERVFLDLNRLYIALGSIDNSKRVGVITSMINTGESVELEIEDIGALYTRAARISDDTVSDFDVASTTEKVVDSYIVDDNDIIGTDEETFATNLIG